MNQSSEFLGMCNVYCVWELKFLYISMTGLYILKVSAVFVEIFPLFVGKSYHQGLDFDDMSSFFPCEIDNAIQYINLGYGGQASKIIIL